MAKISFDDVKTLLENNGWTLLSQEYKNLDTDLEVKCRKGHTLFKPYKTLRRGFTCPFCEESEKLSKQSVTLPKKSSFRILALDQATLITGWSIWDGKELVAHGCFFTKESKNLIKRIADVRNWLINMIDNNKPDLVIFEDIQLQDFQNGKSAYMKNENAVGITTFKALSKLQGVLEVTLEERAVPYKIVFSSTWRSGIGVTGRSRADKKKSAQLLVKRLYNIEVGEDEADAICIGSYGSKNFVKDIKMLQW